MVGLIFLLFNTVGFNNNGLSGTIPQNWPANVENLWFQENILSGTIPDSLSEITFLRELSLYRNCLTGTLPSSLGALSEVLVYISFNDNLLTGAIPVAFGNLTLLVFLYANNNFFTGSVGGLQFVSPYVANLDISSNMFTGSFPFNLADKSLVDLYLSNNEFSGAIGSDINLLHLVENLDISSNSFFGTLPTELKTVRKCVGVLVCWCVGLLYQICNITTYYIILILLCHYAIIGCEFAASVTCLWQQLSRSIK